MLRSTCINYIKREINENIIEFILKPTDSLNISVDTLITSQILDPILFFDMNLVGGREVVVEARYCKKIHEDRDIIIFHVPKALLGGKRILSVLSMHKEYSRVYSNMDISGPVGVTDVEHIGDNNIVVRINERMVSDWLFRLNIEYSNNFYEINRKAYETIGEAAVLAAKMKLYTAGTYLRGKPMFSRGMSMDDIKNIIDSYSDAANEYKEFRRTRLRPSLIFGDKIKKERFLQIITPSNIS